MARFHWSYGVTYPFSLPCLRVAALFRRVPRHAPRTHPPCLPYGVVVRTLRARTGACAHTRFHFRVTRYRWTKDMLRAHACSPHVDSMPWIAVPGSCEYRDSLLCYPPPPPLPVIPQFWIADLGYYVPLRITRSLWCRYIYRINCSCGFSTFPTVRHLRCAYSSVYHLIPFGYRTVWLSLRLRFYARFPDAFTNTVIHVVTHACGPTLRLDSRGCSSLTHPGSFRHEPFAHLVKAHGTFRFRSHCLAGERCRQFTADALASVHQFRAVIESADITA